VIEIIRDKIALIRIGAEWNALAKLFGSPLLCHEWFIACAEVFYDKEDLRIVLVLSQGRIVAIAPLAIVRKKGIEYLELLGSSFLDEPCGLLYDSHDSLEVLFRAILDLERPFYLHKIPSDVSVLRLLSNLIKRKAIFIERSAANTAYVDINSSWESFYNSLSSKRRYDLRRAQRRAEQFGKVSIRIFSPKLETLDNDLNIASKIEAAGWKSGRGSALLVNARLNKFFRVYCATTCKKQILRLGFLSINDIAVAMLIGLEYSSRFWVLKIGYDEKWSRCSPGIQLIHETIRYAFDKSLKSYEFLGSDEPWLRMWAKDSLRHYSSLGVYPASLHGLCGISTDIVCFIYRKLCDKVRSKKVLC